MSMATYVIGSHDPGYQTVRLEEYSFAHREIAERLFNSVRALAKSKCLKEHAGSYSVKNISSSTTIAKVIIFEDSLGKQNGNWPSLEDGVYVLLRADRRGDRIWNLLLPNCASEVQSRFKREQTISVAPTPYPFAYARVSKSDIKSIAQVVASCSLL